MVNPKITLELQEDDPNLGAAPRSCSGVGNREQGGGWDALSRTEGNDLGQELLDVLDARKTQARLGESPETETRTVC